jgi:hypothetical protein
MTSFILICLIGATALWFIRKDMLIIGLMGSLMFTLVYCTIVRVYFLIWPDFINQWNNETFWGSPALGLPVGEILGALAFGLFWPLLVGYCLEVKLSDRSLSGLFSLENPERTTKRTQPS